MGRVVLSLTEQVTLLGRTEEQVRARIDTGATSSSLDVQLAERLGLTPGDRSKIVKSASGVKKRPVITVKLLLQNSSLEEEFTLADRSHMTYPVLIGQNVLRKGNFLVDPQKKENII
ncbi:MAG TPA: RimK/LysX family protein [Candidatus Nanoarchaeia archaeon]|nr:RimK/LysX family protein [Candidatus Nanoarchaeia archaeon]